MLGQVMFAQKLRHCQHKISCKIPLARLITAPTDHHDLKSRSANERMELGSCFIKTKFKRMKCDSSDNNNNNLNVRSRPRTEVSRLGRDATTRNIKIFDSILKLRRKSRLAAGLVMIYRHSLERVNSHLSRYLHRL